jgi:ATP-dependent DNA helicase RecG
LKGTQKIGYFFKELKLTEVRVIGIPTIINALKENGSPAPIFDINDPERTHFLVEIPIHPAFIEEEFLNFDGQFSDQVSDQVTNHAFAIIHFCISPKSRKEILEFLGLTNHSFNFKRHVEPLIINDFLDYTVKENPKDRNQKYVSTELGKAMVDSR